MWNWSYLVPAAASRDAAFSVECKLEALATKAAWRLELDQVREVPLVHVASVLAAAHAASPFMLCRRQFAFPHLLVIVLGLDLLLLMYYRPRWLGR